MPRIGSLIIEAKRARTPLAQAIVQIQERFRSVGEGTRLRGIAFNGIQIAFIMSDGTVLCEGSPSNLAGLLESWMVNLAISPAVPEDIVSLVGSSTGVARMAIRGFWRALRQTHDHIGFVDEAFQVDPIADSEYNEQKCSPTTQKL